MPAPLPARAVAFLSKLSSYQSLIGQDDNYFGAAALAPGEELIGTYTNNEDVPTKNILITNLGIHIGYEDQVSFIPYVQVDSMQWHTWNRDELLDPQNRRLIFYLKSDERLEVHVTGEKKGSMDINQMHNFLLGAVQARQLEKRRSINRLI